jgi:hypothetical protein
MATLGYHTETGEMDCTPLFHPQGKLTRALDFFRNYWCSHYDLCLVQAAKEDLFLDCTQCKFKDSVADDLALFVKK